MTPEFKNIAQRDNIEKNQLILDAWFQPGAKIVDEGVIVLWVCDHDGNHNQKGFCMLENWFALLDISPDKLNHQTGTVEFAASDFVDILPFLIGKESPFVLAKAIYWLGRIVRAAFHIVETKDVISFAGPAGLSIGDVLESCFSFTQADDDSMPLWSTGNGLYVAFWIPGWTDVLMRSLRFTYVSMADKIWGSKWNNTYPWLKQNHARMMTDSWLIVCINTLMKSTVDCILNHEEKVNSNSAYRILYRGERDVLSAWRDALEKGPYSTFAADGWLIARTLRQIFQGSGWRTEWLRDMSGFAFYQIVFELMPPKREELSSDWVLKYTIVHRYFEKQISLATWWCSATRNLEIEHDVLIHPEEWILRTLYAAGGIYPPILKSLQSSASFQCLIPTESLFEFIQNGLSALRDNGFIVRIPEVDSSYISNVRIRVQVQRAKTKQNTLAQSFQSGRWFQTEELVEFDWSIAIGDAELSRNEFEKLVKDRTPYVQLGGVWRLIPIEEIFRQIEDLGLRNNSSNLSVMNLSRSLLMNEEVTGEADNVRVEVSYGDETEKIKEFIHMIQHVHELESVPPPKSFCGSLRQYQLIGYEWLLHLRAAGLGACLADDMGLGKTIQVLAYLLRLKETRAEKGIHLLICPTSLVQNWKAEIIRFAPILKLYIHHGSARNAPLSNGVLPLEIAMEKTDVIITTYATIVRDIEWFERQEFDVVVVDEAQNIKNAQTKQSQSVCKLAANHRIALTGTPIENRLEELWSILHFTNPGYLGSLLWFKKMFADPISIDAHTMAARKLQRIIQPILLRRRKTEPAIQMELPDKWEIMEYAGLITEQAAVYQSIVNQLFEKIDGSRSMSRRGQILAALVRLKQVCDHPCLVTGGSGSVIRSGKLKLLLELLGDVMEEGASALVFTQFRDMGELLCSAIREQFAFEPKFLHGGLTSTARGKIVEDFQIGTDPSPVLVLSLKAGGVGLNLTRANHVFHFDRWWNPAVEDQATDRVFRIGQTKDVQVHKLICSGTLEERIDELIASKRQLSEAIVSHSDHYVTELDDLELRALFDLDMDASIGEDV